MGLVNLNVDVDGPMRGLVKLAGDDLPFLLARTLTLGAQDGQQAAQDLERSGIFQLRNDWTVRNTKIEAATKSKLTAAVYTDTANWQTGAPDYLDPQAEGALKVPHGGHNHLAIPTKYLYRYTSRSKPIPDKLKPRNLLPPNAELKHEYSGSFIGGPKAKRGISRETRKKLQTGEFVAFLQQGKSGTLFIFVRHGGIAGKGSFDAEPWYTLVRSATIVARFPMAATVERVVRANTEDNFGRAIAETRINDALRPTGLSITI